MYNEIVVKNILLIGGLILFIKELLIPGAYLLFVVLFKKKLLEKKYDARKSMIIGDCLNSLVIIYFLLIKDLLMVLVFVFYMMTKYNSYKLKNKKRK